MFVFKSLVVAVNIDFALFQHFIVTVYRIYCLHIIWFLVIQTSLFYIATVIS